MAGILKNALTTVYKNDKDKNLKEYQSLNKKPKTSHVLNLFHIFVNMIPITLTSKVRCDQFFKMFLNFAQLGDQMAVYMVSKKMVGRLFDILHDKHKLNFTFRQYSDVPFEETKDLVIGLPNLKLTTKDVSDLLS